MPLPRTIGPFLWSFAFLALSFDVAGQEDWPVRFEAGGSTFQLYAFQPETMSGNTFSARAAISMERTQDAEPVFGALWGDGVLEVDRDSRLGSLIRFEVDDVRFPGITGKAEIDAIRNTLTEAIPRHAPPISIDWLVAALEQEQQAGDQYSNDPPEIIYRETPAALVFIDGDPLYEKLDASVSTQGGDPLYVPKSRTGLERVLNTPFMILRTGNGDHYLFGSDMWFRSRSLDGPWKREANVPQELDELAAQVKDPAALTSDDRPSSRDPEIVVRYKPAEMLAIDGRPELEPIQNTSLLTVTNTNRSVFMDISSQEYFFLASGRWFKTRDLSSGSWTFVPSDQLPEEFKAIPEGSDRDMVLAHVAGTDAAREAARDASIPQTAKVDRRTASVEVTYEGSPEFERIAGTNVEYALNANTDVLRINGRYHVCDQGVWYEGDTPDGPWQVSTEVPAEVGSIPPESPVYNVRYVYIYDHTPDIVYVGYTPGYLGSYVQNGVVIYGTGFYYRPWPRFWRPRPWTWGFNMYYDPWYGWGLGWGWNYGWVYPHWAMWGPHPYAWSWWGPYAWYPPCCVEPHAIYYGHRPSTSGRVGRSDLDQGAERMAKADRLYADRESNGITASRIAEQSRAPAAQKQSTSEGLTRRTSADHFTDAAGNVYRQNEEGTQRLEEDGAWKRVERPAPASRPADAQRAPDSDRERQPQRTDRSQDVDQRQPVQERQPTQQNNRTRPVTPSRPRAPYEIQEGRQRGVERQRIFRNSTPRVNPAPSRPRVSPGRTPSGRSPSVSPGGGGSRPSGGGGTAPSRSGGSGRTR